MRNQTLENQGFCWSVFSETAIKMEQIATSGLYLIDIDEAQELT